MKPCCENHWISKQDVPSYLHLASQLRAEYAAQFSFNKLTSCMLAEAGDEEG